MDLYGDTSFSGSDDDDDCCYLDGDDDEELFYPEENDNEDSEVDKSADSNYTVLTKEEIRQRQDHDISQVASLLAVSRDEAIILLRHCKWTAEDAYYVSGDDETRKSLGLSTPIQNPNPSSSSSSFTCAICFEPYPQGEFFAAACGHPFCRHCWGGYMKASIGDGPGCLSLRCPHPKCGAAVGESMVHLLAEEEDKKKYSDFVIRSYVENSRLIKWCPAPGCDLAVEFNHGTVSDVTCLCSNRFCWNCGEDAHRPVDCATVEKWTIKNGNEGENTTWILVNCKPCPKCRRQIEKNNGCMHMTCFRGCGFQFCWLCLEAWSKHSGGNFYSCNAYESGKEKGEFKEEERKRKMAKKSLNRYTHYYERWLSNHNSRKKALSDLRKMETVKFKELSDIHSSTESELRVVADAWEQIVECRRVLKWSYAYGYYNCSDDSQEEKRKKAYFEWSQGEAEYWLEKLHEYAEKEIEKYLNNNDKEQQKYHDAKNKDHDHDHAPTPTPEIGFHEYKNNLSALTIATRGYFEKLVKGLENNCC